MQCNYSYRGYVINVLVEVQETLAVSNTSNVKLGCEAIVRVFKEGQRISVFGPVRLFSDRGRCFSTEADAVREGCSAGQRAVDDLAFDNGG